MFDRRSSCIEDLSNELWLDIFDYLDSTKLFLAFHGMNERINQLLVSQKFFTLSLSNFVDDSTSINKFFQDHPLERFKQVQHLKLTYTYLAEDELNIVNHLSSFSALTSLYISFNTDQRKKRNFSIPEYNLGTTDDSVIGWGTTDAGTTGWDTMEHGEIQEKYDEVGECRRLTVDSDTMRTDLEDRFIQILFHQYCPLLQQLYVHGFKNRSQIMNITFGFGFPSLLYIRMSKISLFLAVQTLDRCRQLRSFSSELYYYDESIPSEIATSIMSTLFRSLMPTLNIAGKEFDRHPTVIQNEPDFNDKSLTAMTKLDLKLDYSSETWRVNFLECLLSCCTNLCTFLIDAECPEYETTFFDANWWAKVFASNKKLQRISLQLHLSTRDYETDYGTNVTRNFRSSNFFTQLKANVTYFEDGDFPNLEYNFSIKN